MIYGSKKENMTKTKTHQRKMKIQMLIYQCFLIIAMLTTAYSAFAQADENTSTAKCDDQLSIYYEYYKSKDYVHAYEPWQFSYENCPNATKNLYIHGVKIVKGLIENSVNESDKYRYSDLLMEIYDKRLKYFPENKPYVIASKTTDALRYKKITQEEAYAAYKEAFGVEKAEISANDHAKFFSTVVVLHEANSIPIEEVFEAYDVVINSVENNINLNADTFGKLLEKKDSLNNLTIKEEKNIKRSKIELKNFNSVKGIVDKKISTYATCDRLEPVIERSFEKNKSNEGWLKRNGGILVRKDCNGSSIFSKIAIALHGLNPSASSARYLAAKDYRKGQLASALKYYMEASNLEEDKFKKAADLYKVAGVLAKQGKKLEARKFARQAVSLRGGWGEPYVLIAGLYAKSANNCGTDEFSKRGVYWVAADMAMKAKHIDPSVSKKANRLISSYEKSAPSKTDIFNKGHSVGDSFYVGCWIGAMTKMR